MGLEISETIVGLVATNPLGSDPKSEGDDHIRMIKDVLQKDAPSYDTMGMRNSFINGNFNLWQRGDSPSPLANNYYTADRWNHPVSLAGGNVTIRRSIGTPNTNAFNVLQVECTATEPALAAGTSILVRQTIEARNSMRFHLGSAQAETVTVSFWVNATVNGIYAVCLQNGAENRSYVAEYTVNAASTWEYKTIIIPLDTSGTWLYDTGAGLKVSWVVDAGTLFHTITPDTWIGGVAYTTSNQAHLLGTLGALFNLSQAQIEIGTRATPYEHVPLDTERSRCERYYRTLGSGINGMTLGTTQFHAGYTWPGMRTTPTVALLDNSPTFITYNGVSHSGVASTIAGQQLDRHGGRSIVDGFTALTDGLFVTIENSQDPVWSVTSEL